MKQKQVRWVDVKIGEPFRFWGSHFRDYGYVKVSETESVRKNEYEDYLAAIKLFPDGRYDPRVREIIKTGGETPEELRLAYILYRVVDRVLTDRDEWYGVKR